MNHLFPGKIAVISLIRGRPVRTLVLDHTTGTATTVSSALFPVVSLAAIGSSFPLLRHSRQETLKTILAFRFAQPDSRPATVFCDELDASHLQDALNGLKVVRDRNGSSGLKISDRAFTHLGLGS
jgi:hypothetical protein